MAVQGADSPVDCYTDAGENAMALDARGCASRKAAPWNVQAGAEAQSEESVKDSGRAGAETPERAPDHSNLNRRMQWLLTLYPAWRSTRG